MAVVSIDHKYISSLKVADRHGNIKYTTRDNVSLLGGLGFTVSRDDTSGAFTIAADVSSGADIPEVKAKYSKVIGGGAGGVGPDAYTFTGMPYYMASLNDTRPHPHDGTLFILGGACMQLGLFKDNAHPSEDAAKLEMFDMCTADVDCEDYKRLFIYIRQLNDFVDANKDNNLIAGTRLFRQYEASVHYWNYLVNSLSLILKVTESNAGLLVSAGYRCMDCGPYVGVSYSVTITFVSVQPGLEMAFKGRASDSNRSSLKAIVTSGTSSFVGVASDDMKLRDWLVTNTHFGITTEIEPPPTGSNIFLVTCTWRNTAFGASVSRSKQLLVEYVRPPS